MSYGYCVLYKWVDLLGEIPDLLIPIYERIRDAKSLLFFERIILIRWQTLVVFAPRMWTHTIWLVIRLANKNFMGFISLNFSAGLIWMKGDSTENCIRMREKEVPIKSKIWSVIWSRNIKNYISKKKLAVYSKNRQRVQTVDPKLNKNKLNKVWTIMIWSSNWNEWNKTKKLN